MNNLTKERVLEIIAKINNFEIDGKKPFVVVGPAGNGARKLRVYCNGGCVGWIGYPGKSNCELFEYGYLGYLSDCEINSISSYFDSEKNKMISGEECNNVIDSEKYLRTAYIATKNRYGKKSGGAAQERDIQVGIVKEFMNNSNSDWHVIDMETSITKSMVPDSTHIKNVKKPDIVVFDKAKNEFGLIELKFNNESTDNLREHYDVSKDIFDDPGNTIKELIRRAEIMSEFKLIDGDYIANKKDIIISANKIWFGFLFVDGGKDGAVKTVEKHLSGIDVSDACRFLYVDSIEELYRTGITFDKMSCYGEFVK